MTGPASGRARPSPAVTTSFVYDVNRGLPVLLDDGARKHVWGLGLAYAVDTGSGGLLVYHTDGLGSVRALSNSSGDVTATYQSDEFGVPLVTHGGSTQPFEYTGEPRDEAVGMIYLRAREYDSSVGWFPQQIAFCFAEISTTDNFARMNRPGFSPTSAQ